VASFNFSPTAPLAGDGVAFAEVSSNAPTSWIWNFGDPASGAANSSTLQNPSHMFASAGTYTVTLTAANSAGSGSTSLAVTVSPVTASTRSATLPVAGHVVGVGGVLFLTDVQIENPNPFPINANLLFFPVGGGAAPQVPLLLSPLETRSLPDVVASLFDVTDSFGALRCDTTGSPAPAVRMTSRTYDRVGDGTASDEGLRLAARWAVRLHRARRKARGARG
jgi:PKD repeat protein